MGATSDENDVLEIRQGLGLSGADFDFTAPLYHGSRFARSYVDMNVSAKSHESVNRPERVNSLLCRVFR
jgi:hypothetical protein